MGTLLPRACADLGAAADSCDPQGLGRLLPVPAQRLLDALALAAEDLTREAPSRRVGPVSSEEADPRQLQHGQKPRRPIGSRRQPELVLEVEHHHEARSRRDAPTCPPQPAGRWPRWFSEERRAARVPGETEAAPELHGNRRAQRGLTFGKLPAAPLLPQSLGDSGVRPLRRVLPVLVNIATGGTIERRITNGVRTCRVLEGPAIARHGLHPEPLAQRLEGVRSELPDRV